MFLDRAGARAGGARAETNRASPPPRASASSDPSPHLQILEAVQRGSVDDVRRELLDSESARHVNAQTEYAGQSALHQAAEDGRAEIAALLVQHDDRYPTPLDLNARDKDWKTPLHRAALRGHGAVLEILLAAGADCAAQMRGGRTPYDCAVLHRADGSAACARMLLEHYQLKLWQQHAEQALHALLREATFRPSEESESEAGAHQPTVAGSANQVQLPIGQLEVHEFCHAVAQGLIRASSGRVLQARRGPCLDWPVHTAARRNAPPAVLEYLVEQDPHCAAATTAKGWLPLHLACSNSRHPQSDAAPSAVDAIVEFWHRRVPASLRTPTVPAGNLPLHVACRNGARLATVQALTRWHRAALYARNDRGSLPLHVACHSSAAPDVLKFLARESVEYAAVPHHNIAVDALHAPDGTGALPLHLACRSGFPVQTVVELLVAEGGPETVRARDSRGALPLHHLLCRSLVPAPAVERLLHWHPSAVAERTAAGYPPFLLAAGHGAPLDVVQTLVRGYLGWNADLSLGNNNFVTAATAASATATANNNNNDNNNGNNSETGTENSNHNIMNDDDAATANNNNNNEEEAETTTV